MLVRLAVHVVLIAAVVWTISELASGPEVAPPRAGEPPRLAPAPEPEPEPAPEPEGRGKTPRGAHDDLWSVLSHSRDLKAEALPPHSKPTLRPRVTREAAITRLRAAVPDSLMRRHKAGLEQLIDEMSREYIDAARITHLVALAELECGP